MLFFISFFMFYLSYLFSVLFLVLMVMLMMMFYMTSFFFIKYLIILVYVSGVVVFILYISCMCWFIDNQFSKMFFIFSIFIFYVFDMGLFSKFSDIGEHLWMYLFFSFLFNSLITVYCLNLFKISGSLRF